jgi:2'-5' RNA ligase
MPLRDNDRLASRDLEHFAVTAMQGSLFGSEPVAALPTDNLFFALLPDETTAGTMAAVAARLCRQYGLRGKAVPPERLHVTLYYLGAYAGVPTDLVERACSALAAFRTPTFDVCLDRVMSFSRRSNRPVVLVGGQSSPLHAFQGRLRSVLVSAHLPEPDRLSFTPHVTLLRDDREVPEQAVEPMCWTAREFVLIRSLHGRGEYRILARFPCGD